MKTTALSVALVIALASGCGGGGDNGGGSGASSPSKGVNSSKVGSSASKRPEASGKPSRPSTTPSRSSGPSASKGSSGGPATSKGSSGSGEPGGGSGEAGGGSGGNSQSAAGSSLSKAQFVKQANALCALSNQESIKALKAYAQRNAGKPTQERLEGALKEVYVPALEAEATALRLLGAPPGDKAKVDAISGAIESWVELAKEKGQAAKPEIDRRIARAAKLERGYGLVECSSG